MNERIKMVHIHIRVRIDRLTMTQGHHLVHFIRCFFMRHKATSVRDIFIANSREKTTNLRNHSLHKTRKVQDMTYECEEIIKKMERYCMLFVLILCK